jgi:chromosome segregation ATPase
MSGPTRACSQRRPALDHAPPRLKRHVGRGEEGYRRAWEADRLASALEMVRNSLPGVERQVKACEREIGEWENHLAELERLRTGFVEELAALPEDTSRLTAQEEDRIRYRRQDLRSAIAAHDGAPAQGTLVDHLWNAYSGPS